MAEEADELEVKTPAGSIRARGTDIIALIAMVGIVLIAYSLWEHKAEAREANVAFVSAVKEMSAAQKEQVKIMRLQACIISRPQEVREAEFSSQNSFCQRMAGQ